MKEERKNTAKFSGHYIHPRTHAQRSCTRNPLEPIHQKSGISITYFNIYLRNNIWDYPTIS